jgi:dihydrolipoamide dehydrogenase
MTTASNKNTPLLVIGAGPGGYTAAFYAADLGMEVTLVDLNANPGGICLYNGCIPSKTLLHAASILAEAKDAQALGITFSPPKIDLDKLRLWKSGAIAKLAHGLGQLTRQRRIKYIQGRAKFLDSRTAEIEKNDRSKETLTFEKAILATGSMPISLSHAPFSRHILNSTTALALEDIPSSLLIVGGGSIGLEVGTIYASLGSAVSIAEMMPGILPGADRDLTDILGKRLQTIFTSVLLNTQVMAMKEIPNGIKVTLKSENGETTAQEFEKVLISVGRSPNSDNLGLENTKVEIDERGFVKVNAQRLSADPSIYAIGDVAGEPLLAHKASHEGRVAVEAILGKKTAFEPKAIPTVVFTDPEIAFCGLTETQAARENRQIKVAKFPWGASGRAVTLNRTDGLTKLIIDPVTRHILGVGLAGYGAGEMISEGVLAVEMGAVAEDLNLAIHPHPTTSETIMEAAEGFFGYCTHIYRPPRKE